MCVIDAIRRLVSSSLLDGETIEFPRNYLIPTVAGRDLTKGHQKAIF